MDKLNQHKSDSSVSIKPMSETENNGVNIVVQKKPQVKNEESNMHNNP
jgi:hypothetical protein